ncbi:MAG: hypothetical protein ACYTE8_02715 [Planctomycetota bacterium]|jgi:ABC-type multidrug transport system fused ATPase/permease subunit
MAIEARCSKHKKKNFKIYIGACLLFAFALAYDGYLSKYEWSLRNSFYKKHVVDGQPDDIMKFNQKAPFFLLALAIGLAAWSKVISNRKIVADENELVINNKEKIAYDSINKIDKTYFDKNGYFTITYGSKDAQSIERKISDKNYDNLSEILEHLTAKIS